MSERLGLATTVTMSIMKEWIWCRPRGRVVRLMTRVGTMTRRVALTVEKNCDDKWTDDGNQPHDSALDELLARRVIRAADHEDANYRIDHSERAQHWED